MPGELSRESARERVLAALVRLGADARLSEIQSYASCTAAETIDALYELEGEGLGWAGEAAAYA